MKPYELVSLIQRVLDGDLPADDFQRLETELLSNPEALQTYRKYVWLSSSLDVKYASQIPLGETSVVPVGKVIALQKRRAFKVATIAAAAIIVIGLLAMRLFFIDTTRQIGRAHV